MNLARVQPHASKTYSLVKLPSPAKSPLSMDEMLFEYRLLRATGDRITKVRFKIAMTNSVVKLLSPANESLSMDAIWLEYNTLYITHQLGTSSKTSKA